MQYLNLGCGRRYHPSWTNMDVAAHAPSVIGPDLSKGNPVPDASSGVVDQPTVRVVPANLASSAGCAVPRLPEPVRISSPTPHRTLARLSRSPCSRDRALSPRRRGPSMDVRPLLACEANARDWFSRSHRADGDEESD